MIVGKRGSKKGAMEMSVGTIVTIVLLMTVLILGLVLVRTIFVGSKYNIDTLNEKVRAEINKLFVEDQKVVVYLSNYEVVVKQGERWGVAWAVKNLNTGTAQSAKLSYDIEVSDLNLRTNCGINTNEAMSYIKQGQAEDNIPLPPGQSYYSITRIVLPETSPLCTIRYRINTKLDGADYSSTFFDLTISSK